MSITVTPGAMAPVFIGIGQPDVIAVSTGQVDVIDVEAGISGPPGPKGPEGGTPVVPVPFDEWPPVDPQPDTLYLRLAP